jgi:NAD kinase
MEHLRKAGKRQVERSRYPGLALNLSNCSKINRMHVCLNEIALKASESSYMLDTFSNDIS